MVLAVASEWTRFANVRFDAGAEDFPQDCTNNGKDNIKIAFAKAGEWSYVGTDSHRFTPSMNLQDLDIEPGVVTPAEFKRLVLHEFGHALGLEHEHQSPEARCDGEIDWTAAVTYYQKLGWDADKTRFNLRTLVAGPRLRTTEYDPKSIMHYSLPAEIFKNGRNSRCFTSVNYELSELDKRAIAFAYPEDKSGTSHRRDELIATLDKVMTNGGVDQSERVATIDRVKRVYQISGSIEVIGGDKNTTRGNCSPIIDRATGNITVSCIENAR